MKTKLNGELLMAAANGLETVMAGMRITLVVHAPGEMSGLARPVPKSVINVPHGMNGMRLTPQSVKAVTKDTTLMQTTTALLTEHDLLNINFKLFVWKLVYFCNYK